MENEEDAVDADDLDELLVDYFHVLLESGAGKSAANSCYYGLLMLDPSLQGKLPVAAKARSNYDKMFPSTSYLPLTRQMMHLIAFELHSRCMPEMALAVLLGFEALLRISEACGLYVSDIVDSKDNVARLGVVLPGFSMRLRKTKTGVNQWCRAEDATVCRLLREQVARQRRAGKDKLFD